MDGTTQFGFALNIDCPFTPQAEADRDPVGLPKADVPQAKHGETVDLPHYLTLDINLDHPALDHLSQTLLDQVRAIITFFDRLADMLGGDQFCSIQSSIIAGFTEHI